MRSILLVSTVLFSVSSIVAQVPIQNLPLRSRSYHYPSPTFGRAVAGKVSTNSVPDVMVVENGVGVLITGAAMQNADLQVPVIPPVTNGLTDLDIVPLGGIGAGTDSVALVSAIGLQVWALHPDDQSDVLQSIESSQWVNARAVRAAKLDTAFGADLVGLSADGLTLLRCFSTANRGYSVSTPIGLSAPAFALEPVDWDSNGIDEVAVLTTAGFEVRSATGALITSIAYPAQLGKLCRFKTTGADQECLAWLLPLTANPGTQAHALAVVGANTVEIVDLGGLHATGISAGKFNGDAFDDIAIAQANAHEVSVLYNLKMYGPTVQTFYYASGLAIRVPLGTGSSGCNVSRPVLSDLDGDGDHDLMIGSANVAKVVIAENTFVDAAAMRVTPVAGGSIGNVNANGFEVTMNLGTFTMPGDTPDRIEVLMWGQQSSSLPELNPDVRYRFLVNWPASQITMTLPFSNGDSPLAVAIRAVKVDTQDRTIRAWPAWLGGMTFLRNDRLVNEALPGAGVTTIIEDDGNYGQRANKKWQFMLGVPVTGGITPAPWLGPIPRPNKPPAPPPASSN